MFKKNNTQYSTVIFINYGILLEAHRAIAGDDDATMSRWRCYDATMLRWHDVTMSMVRWRCLHSSIAILTSYHRHHNIKFNRQRNIAIVTSYHRHRSIVTSRCVGDGTLARAQDQNCDGTCHYHRNFVISTQ